MTPQLWVEQLLQQSDQTEQRRFLRAYSHMFDDQVAETLKNKTIQLRLIDTQRALQIADLIFDAAQLTRNPRHRGYGLWAAAVVRSLGLGEYQHALELYDEAITIFTREGDELSPAIMQVSRLWSLANLNRHSEAFAAGQQASIILERYGKWLPLATLNMNLASVYTRLGEYAKALTMFEHAQRSYEALDEMNEEIESLWAHAVNNRAISLCYLGKFEDSIQASQMALKVQEQLGNRIEAARIRQHLAVTYFILGRYNEALKLLQLAHTVFLEDGLKRHAARVDLYISDCLLRLRRFNEVLEKSPQILALFQELKAPHEEGLAIFYKAIAYAGLKQDEEALKTLAQARHLFEMEKSSVWVAHTDLEKALILHRQSRFAESVVTAQACANTFREQNLLIKEAEAHLLAAQAMTALQQYDEAIKLVEQVEHVAESKDVPLLILQSHYLRGVLARTKGDLPTTHAEYEKAIAALERLRGQLMVEFRVNFQEDKQVLYEDMVDVCLDMQRPDHGLEYAERAKSRALLELLDYRLDIRIQVKQEADRPLVEKLLQLRAERDQLCRHWENHEQAKERGWSSFEETEQNRQNLLRLENQIADLWHRLLIQNADYTQDAALWQVSVVPLTLDLPLDTLLVEYFIVHDQLIVFLVTKEGVSALRLAADLARVRQLVERLNRHMQTVHEFPADHLPNLAKQAQFFLNELYKLLIAPFRKTVRRYQKLIFVPHGALHYLPFHALHDGKAFLIESHEISYLPNASILPFCRKVQPLASGILIIGYSANGQLSHATQEARAVANLFAGTILLEDQATSSQLRKLSASKSLLHLATHAEYHDDQPLFSGLMLADGWLTTLDIFNLELNTALVTLSACQTGRNVIGGGDELLGLMRAFFYAGTASLVLSMWAVEDRSTAAFMEMFYRQLKKGMSKSAALRYTQRQWIRGKRRGSISPIPNYSHPYFWAPFFLVGDTAPLTPMPTSISQN